MNIKTLFLENKTASSLVLSFVIGSGLFGYLAWSAWDNYDATTADYTAKAADLDHLSHKEIFPSASNLRKLSLTLTENQGNLAKLRKSLQTYRISSFGAFEKSKSQDQPQYFQDALREEVTAVKGIASISGATLPSNFYLGLDEYENRLPQPEQLPLLSKQLTVLDWLGKNVAGLKGAIVADFSRTPMETAKTPIPSRSPKPLPVATPTTSSAYESLGSIRITLRCDQGEFRELINSISTAPYFLVIEDLKVQNSAGEPPRRDASPTTDQPPADGTTAIQRLPIIVGRETLNVFLKIRIIDFPSTQNQPGASK
jgi:hypothetical protein